jgi:hypothetical protein
MEQSKGRSNPALSFLTLGFTNTANHPVDLVAFPDAFFARD